MEARFFASTLMLGASMLAAQAAFAYPEFQVYVETHSGRNVNCAMCHTHPDGPDGLKPGQIGSFDPSQIERLNRARAAFEPGQNVDNPVLNEFGNQIVEFLGKLEVLELRQDPAAFPSVYGFESDLDGDGIPDAQEYIDGTHPLNPHHGDPWALFFINLQRRWFDILMIGLATAAGLYGLNNFVRGYERQRKTHSDAGKVQP